MLGRHFDHIGGVSLETGANLVLGLQRDEAPRERSWGAHSIVCMLGLECWLLVVVRRAMGARELRFGEQTTKVMSLGRVGPSFCRLLLRLPRPRLPYVPTRGSRQH
jgi:hypothetical protein